MTRSILIVDDDSRIRTSLSQALRDGSTELRTAETGEDALVRLGEASADVVLADLRMPGMGGIELLRLLRQRMPETDVVLMTAHEDLPTVATAMREGARDFLIKPLDLHPLRRLLERIFEDRDMRARIGDVPPANGITDRLVGRDRRMVEIFKLVGQVAPTRTTVLVRGESGTGKELVAQEIHRASPRADQPFVAVNCASVPETLLESELFGHVRGAFTGASGDRKGRFAQAGNGTVFLDEIGDTTPEFQSKLLRVLENREFHPVGSETAQKTDARVIAATHRNLEDGIDNGSFREDLYYRLRVVEVTVPPLRERLGDLAMLARHLVQRTAEDLHRKTPVIADDSLEVLVRHEWPGNVRELENTLTRALVLATGNVIRPEHLALRREGEESPDGLDSLDDVERRHVSRVLQASRGNKTKASEILGVSRPRLNRLLEKYRLE